MVQSTPHPHRKVWEGWGRRGGGACAGGLDPLKASEEERCGRSRGGRRRGVRETRREAAAGPATVIARAGVGGCRGWGETGRSRAADPPAGTQGRPRCPAADCWRAKPFSRGS